MQAAFKNTPSSEKERRAFKVSTAALVAWKFFQTAAAIEEVKKKLSGFFVSLLS